jgi:uncharacterized membrane protein
VDPILWPLYIVIALVGLLFLLMPGLTRPDVFFAVTVEPAFRATGEGRRATALYRAVSVAASVLALAALWLTAHRDAREPWAVLALLVQIAGTTGGFLLARRLVLPHAAQPATAREAVLSPSRGALPGGWLLQAVPFLVLAVIAVVVQLRWADMPARMPVHWTLAGHADRWADRTPAGVFMPIVTAALMCGLMLATAIGLLRSRRVRATGEGAPGEAAFRRVTIVVLFVAEMLIALAASQPSLRALYPANLVVPILGAATAAGAVVTVLLVLFMVRLGQGGSRRAPLPAGGAPVGDRTPDSAWILGMIYVNHDDPALLVEKRFGIGYTLNFGHPLAWVLIGLLVGILVLLTMLRHG